MVIFETMLAGLAGTGAMTLLMLLVHEVGWAPADMIRALGSAFTGSYENSVLPGLLIHFGSGVLFSFPYVLVLSGLNFTSIWGTVGAGALIGFVHGFVMSFLLVAAVAEKHRLEQFRTAGFEVAAAHVAGHVGYGAAVGAVAAALSIDFGFRF